MIFLGTIIILLFLPGYFLLQAVFGNRKILAPLEKFVFSFALSIISVDFIFFLYSKLNLPITRLSSMLGVLAFVLICFGIYKIKARNWIPGQARNDKNNNDSDINNSLFDFSKKQFSFILLFIFLMVFLKTVFLTGSILPTSTDMGHHLYWAKWMSENHQLPTYEGMPDFIIGEHIIFGIINLWSGASFFGAFPIVVLNLINIFGILAVFLLVLRIFKDKTTAILSLFFLGVLFAVSSPQSKFVATGVIGNIMGNMLMPIVFYFYFRALEFFHSGEKFNANSKTFLALGIFANFGLFYTHHLTSFIFLFIFLFSIVFYLLLNLKNSKNIITQAGKMFFSPKVFLVFALGLVFFFFIFTPNYAKLSAVDTAVGSAVKITRIGLTFDNLKSAIGESRLALGFLGFVILLWKFQRKNFGHLILAGWTIMLFIMSTRPTWLFIDLPSNRIGNYLTYPLAILTAYAFAHVFLLPDRNMFVSKFLFKSAFGLILAFVLLGGTLDAIKAFKKPDSASEMNQTFNVSQYLAEKTSLSDMVLKDHNYLTADSWMKLFFMRDYRYPLSRGYFRRYEDQTNPREMCTLWMISNPAGEETPKCFSETGTNFLVVNPQFDSLQFIKLNNFDKVYASKDIAVFYKKQ